MSRFGRNQSFIASHFTHGFPGSPRAFHQIEPLTWGTYMAYGGTPYGWSTSWVPGVRWTRSDLIARKANVSTYDHYDAVTAVLKLSPGRSVESYPQYAAFLEIASNDASALLKTAYWLAVAGVALSSTPLKDLARNQAEVGYTDGTAVDATSRTSNIGAIYDSAVASLKKYYTSGTYNATADAALAQLQKSSPAAVKARIEQTKRYDASKTKAEEESKKQPETPEIPCSDTLWGKIPGYCESKMLYKVVGYTLAAVTVVWGVKKIATTLRSNPDRRQLTLENPSAPGNMTDEPEAEIAAMPKGRRQEKNLAKTAFLRRSR